MMMTVVDLSARVRRLEELTRGLAKEVTRWQECNDSLLYMERRAHLDAMQNALRESDDARVAQAQARQRLLDGTTYLTVEVQHK
jgi:hypothetical protein